MEATIKAIHFDISEKLTAFINKKIDKISRRFEAVTAATVTASKTPYATSSLSTAKTPPSTSWVVKSPRLSNGSIDRDAR